MGQQTSEAAAASAEIESIIEDDDGDWDQSALKAAVKREFDAPGLDYADADLEILEVADNIEDVQNAIAMVKDKPANKKAIKKLQKAEKAAREEAAASIAEAVGDSAPDLSSLPLSSVAEIAAAMEGAKKKLLSSHATGQQRKDLRKKGDRAKATLERLSSDDPPSSQEVAEAMVAVRMVEVLSDPLMLDPASPLSEMSTSPIPKNDEAAVTSRMTEHSIKSMGTYRSFDKEERDEHRKSLAKQMEAHEEAGTDNSEQYAMIRAQLRGIQLASALEDGDNAEGVSPVFQGLLKAADKQGRLQEYARLNLTGHKTDEEAATAQEQFRSILNDVDDEGLAAILPEDHPARAALDAIAKDAEMVRKKKNKLPPFDKTFFGSGVGGGYPFLGQESIDRMRNRVRDAILEEVLFTDNELIDDHTDASGNKPTVGFLKGLKKKKIEPKNKGDGKAPKTNAGLEALKKMMAEMQAKLKKYNKGKTGSTSPQEHYDFEPWGYRISDH